MRNRLSRLICIAFALWFAIILAGAASGCHEAIHTGRDADHCVVCVLLTWGLVLPGAVIVAALAGRHDDSPTPLAPAPSLSQAYRLRPRAPPG
jgi:hypothetical protein